MALKFKITDKTQIPAEHTALYAERDGAFYLDVEGVVPKERLDEFRTNNTALIKERDELKTRFDGIDPEDFKRLKSIEKELEDKKLTGKDAETILAQRTAAMKADHDKALATLTKERDGLTAELAKARISEAVVAEGIKKGLRQSAVTDLVGRAAQAWKLDKDGKPVAYDGAGAERYGKTGERLAMGEWLDELIQSAPHLFEASQGTGASGGKGGGTGTVNPWKKEHWNMTKQGAIMKENPQLAARLKAEAGAK